MSRLCQCLRAIPGVPKRCGIAFLAWVVVAAYLPAFPLPDAAVAVKGAGCDQSRTRRYVVAAVICEDEYRAKETLPKFLKELATAEPLRPWILLGDEKKTSIPGLETIDQADLVVLFIRRATLPAVQLEGLRRYLSLGKPLVALRTSSHAFENWKEFDREVLGGNYRGHYGQTAEGTRIFGVPTAREHPVLRGLPEAFVSRGTLYRTSPLRPDATVLLEGQVVNHPPEPVAWVRQYGKAKVFYTSLGHPNDFENPAFRTLLANGVRWALEIPNP
jgi:type 1 glutamine amidotransferase